MKKLQRLFFKIYIRKIFKKYKDSLPTTTKIENPKIQYHVICDSLFWEDEGIAEFCPELENVFRDVLFYRTELLTNEIIQNEYGFYKQIFDLAKKNNPNWIGFKKERCTYNEELKNKLTRIRKVSDWKIDKFVD